MDKKKKAQVEGKKRHTLKKFTKERSSGTSAVFDVVDDGSRGPSITDMLGTASSSSNSL